MNHLYERIEGIHGILRTYFQRKWDSNPMWPRCTFNLSKWALPQVLPAASQSPPSTPNFQPRASPLPGAFPHRTLTFWSLPFVCERACSLFLSLSPSPSSHFPVFPHSDFPGGFVPWLTVNSPNKYVFIYTLTWLELAHFTEITYPTGYIRCFQRKIL